MQVIVEGVDLGTPFEWGAGIPEHRRYTTVSVPSETRALDGWPTWAAVEEAAPFDALVDLRHGPIHKRASARCVELWWHGSLLWDSVLLTLPIVEAARSVATGPAAEALLELEIAAIGDALP